MKNRKQSEKPFLHKQRLLSLDVMRGITIAGMILVNNPGRWSDIYAPLRHAEWNGLTPTDLVFPFFMFIMGVSAYFSLSKYSFRLSIPAIMKILRRTIIIFFIGLLLAWLGLWVNGIAYGGNLLEVALSFNEIRIPGVLPRLALAYGFAALIALSFGKRSIPFISVGLLVLYSIILIIGDGLEFSDRNIIAVTDRAVFGTSHLYTEHVGGQSLKFDPESLLGTIPSIAHVLIGFLAGKIIMERRNIQNKVVSLFVLGTFLAFGGLLLSYGIPINKKIWSPTFVLTTCGFASLLLGLLIYMIEIKGYRGWCQFFEVFGANPLALYVLASVLSILLGYTLQGIIYESYLSPLCYNNLKLASLLYALLFVGVIWICGLFLFKRHIYIKI